MNIQDLGAIGEFVSSVVIVITPTVLVYEVRSAKRATLLANAQERRRDRTTQWRTVIDAPQLAAIAAKAANHIGDPRLLKDAHEYGLEPEEYAQLNNYYQLSIAHWSDGLYSELPEHDRRLLDYNIQTRLWNPTFAKWYDQMVAATRAQGLDHEHPVEELFRYVEKIRLPRPDASA